MPLAREGGGDVIEEKVCDGRCLYPSDLGFPEWDRGEPAYPDPYCSLHGEEEEMAPVDGTA